MKSRESKNAALSAAKKQMLLQKVGVLNRFYPDFVAKCEALRPFYCNFRLVKWGFIHRSGDFFDFCQRNGHIVPKA